MAELKYSTGFVSIPLMQVRHKSIVVYPDVTGRKKTLSKKPTFDGQKTYSGRVTCGVRKRMTKAINILLQTAKGQFKKNPYNGVLQWHKLTFLTLKITHVDNINARDGYNECLSYFLDWFTRTAETSRGKGVRLYVCKAELTIAGQLHYHITFPDMIHLQDVKDKWNSILRKAGYLDQYAKVHGHYHANSTDIHSVNDVENLSAYMVKAFTDSLQEAEKMKKRATGKVKHNIEGEMTKDVQNGEGTEGKIWSCSELLSAAHYVKFHQSTRHMEILESLERDGRVKWYSDETGFWAVYQFTDCSPPEIMNREELAYIDNYLAWQMERPSKSADIEDFEAWAKAMPLLEYPKGLIRDDRQKVVQLESDTDAQGWKPFQADLF